MRLTCIRHFRFSLLYGLQIGNGVLSVDVGLLMCFLPNFSTQIVLYSSVSQPPGRGLVSGPGINYTGLREVNIL
jgi:hypothetical protein